ncbi:hypothetical protein [Candidatus Magnetobacterium casense]|uniref:Uncharacterized protein n=1 Tax=Candidatus Magnetobacterium casense TaxID=1455061 RepID=A0ABS6S1U6_9BACT|nr:hypothetical protein [Candidatus Magnetobacterium casensis]MBV6342826.1 hypothetical protein [Candidatus Magnetobacterium casensis]
MRKVIDWTDRLAESELPEDELTFTDGSNYGLDGFHFEGLDNLGVEDGARLPETRGLSGLPDGIVTDPKEATEDPELTDDDGIVLEEMLSEEEGGPFLDPVEKTAASVANLEWLDPTQEQDPNRLPEPLRSGEPPLNSIPELEEAWGVHRRTDGVSLVPNKDKEIVEYEKSIAEGPKSGLPGNKTADDLRDAVMRAVRRSHFGHKLSSIKSELESSLGVERAERVCEIIESDHGLVGNVFVRASVFPGLRNGRWVKELRRSARTARYVITDDPAVAAKLSMKMVSEVPWEEALEHYRPWLVASGRRMTSVLSKNDPRSKLRRAFLSTPDVRQESVSYHPVVKEDVRVSRETPVKSEVSQVRTSEVQATDRKRHRVLVRIARWVVEGRLSKAMALKLRDLNVGPEELARRAAQVVANSKTARAYTGASVREVPIGVGHPSIDRTVSLEKSELRKAQAYLARKVEAGVLTKEEARRIVAFGKTASGINRLTVAAVAVASKFRKVGAKVARFNPGEYALGNKNLDQVTLAGKAPSLEGVSFGDGMML